MNTYNDKARLHDILDSIKSFLEYIRCDSDDIPQLLSISNSPAETQSSTFHQFTHCDQYLEQFINSLPNLFESARRDMLISLAHEDVFAIELSLVEIIAQIEASLSMVEFEETV
ncbi:hypothetical protein [Photobacterium leiognathi]|uniref:hypothetical protein n=1 Tax=Photobacterium leiognathi TaxID=553611 RepID=UPI0029820E91|nr:hypothetical protein [Photobacterium leiognathi]